MTPARRPTIVTIARDCGVTDGTVSRALREDPRVAEATRRRVLEAARRLGYRPNASAQGLKRGSAGAVGLVCEAGAWLFYNDYFGRLIAGVGAAAAADGKPLVLYLPQVRSTDSNPAHDLVRLRGLDDLDEGRVDGAIVVGGSISDKQGLERLQRSRLPLLLLGADEPISGFAQLGSGAGARARAAAEALRAAGRRRIGYLGLFEGSALNRVAAEALKDWAAAARLPQPLVSEVDRADYAEPRLLAPRLQALLDGGCEGLIVASPLQARVCLRLLKSWGKAVPEQLGLVSFAAQGEELPPPSPGEPSLALVQSDLEAAGAQAYAMFKRLLQGGGPESAEIAWAYRPRPGGDSLAG